MSKRKNSNSDGGNFKEQTHDHHENIESGGKCMDIDGTERNNSNPNDEHFEELAHDHHQHINSGGKYVNVDGTKQTNRCAYGTAPNHIMPYRWSYYKLHKNEIKMEIFAGLTVAFAQVGESIAFSFIAGVGPLLGLHAAWIIGLITSLFGSRPGMINGATGVQAAIIAPFVQRLGVGYVFYIVMMIAAFQALFGLVRITAIIPLIPHTVMIGFVNGLAIILALGQVGQFKFPAKSATNVSNFVTNITENVTDIEGHEAGWLPSETTGLMFILIVICVAIIFAIPRCKYTKVLPAGICGILTAALIEHLIFRALLGIETPTIGEVSNVNGGFPILFFSDPQYQGMLPPLDLTTFKTIIVPAFIAASAGTVECVLTMEVVNDLTSSGNDRPSQQLYALAAGNFVSGLFGTMGGGATIGLSVMNCMSGATGLFRISGVIASLTMLIFILALSQLIQAIPTAALVGIMVVTCSKTFDWESLMIIFSSSMPQCLRRRTRLHAKINRTDALTIIVVTVVTLVLDLFSAVLAGILFTGIVYAWQSGMDINVTPYFNAKRDKKVYVVNGPLFFGSAQRFVKLFNVENDPDEIEIDFRFGASKIYDFSGFVALNSVSEKYQKENKKVTIKRLDSDSKKRLEKLNILVKYFEFGNDNEPEELIPIIVDNDSEELSPTTADNNLHDSSPIQTIHVVSDHKTTPHTSQCFESGNDDLDESSPIQTIQAVSDRKTTPESSQCFKSGNDNEPVELIPIKKDNNPEELSPKQVIGSVSDDKKIPPLTPSLRL